MLAVERPEEVMDEPAGKARDEPAADGRRLLPEGRLGQARLPLVQAPRE